MKITTFFLLLVICVFSVSISAQTKLIPETYLKIKPAISTLDDVETLFGKSDTNNHTAFYKFSGGVMQVDYSDGDCKSGMTLWRIPEWTVVEVFYIPSEEKPLRLQDVILNSSKFKRRHIGDIIGQTKYYNEENGVSAVYLKGDRIVSSISVQLTAEQKKLYACPTN